MHERKFPLIKNDLVSIIMPAYNSENTISASIKSVLAQTYTEWELIIVDDCSNDNTKQVIQELGDSRIRYFKLAENQGVAVARNCGIAKARGRYLAFLDSDDLWLPGKLSQQTNFMKKNNYAFTYTCYRQFTDNIENCKSLVTTKPFVDYKELLKGNDIGCLTVMIDQTQIPTVYMPLERHEDYVAWLEILKHGGKAYSLSADLARYRKSGLSLTSNKVESMAWTWRVYRKTQKLSRIESFYYLACYILQGLKKHCL